MEAYLRGFVNYKQNNKAKPLPIAEFAYHDAKNASTGHTQFKLNCGYHPGVSSEGNVELRSKSKSAEELAIELKELLTVCRENLRYFQDLQKQQHNKNVKLRSYAPDDKV